MQRQVPRLPYNLNLNYRRKTSHKQQKKTSWIETPVSDVLAIKLMMSLPTPALKIDGEHRSWSVKGKSGRGMLAARQQRMV